MFLVTYHHEFLSSNRSTMYLYIHKLVPLCTHIQFEPLGFFWSFQTWHFPTLSKFIHEIQSKVLQKSSVQAFDHLTDTHAKYIGTKRMSIYSYTFKSVIFESAILESVKFKILVSSENIWKWHFWKCLSWKCQNQKCLSR